MMPKEDYNCVRMPLVWTPAAAMVSTMAVYICNNVLALTLNSLQDEH